MNKHFKKAIAVALAGAMSLSSFAVTSFAQSVTEMNKLAILQNLDVLKGEGSGINPDKNMSRYRAITMMLRLSDDDQSGKNLEDYMNNYNSKGKQTFTDAENKSPFVKKLMAYCKNNNVGIDGYLDGSFKPLKEITAKEYAKVMLEVLGYDYNADFNWQTVGEKAEQVGIVKDASEINDNVITILDVADMTYNALATPVKGSDITLGEAIDKPVVETKLAVKSVKAINLKQIKVTFNKAVDKDSATDLNNYKLEAATAKLTGGNVDLLDDNKTVIITLGTAAEQQEKVKLTVDKIQDLKEKVITKTTVEDIRFLDITVPEAESADAIGNRTIKVTFSEPIKTVSKSDFKIRQNNKDLYIKSVSKLNNDTEINIELYSQLKEGNVSVQVNSGAKDYADFGVIFADLTAGVSIDEEAPHVVGYKDATPNGVTLIFNEEVKLVDGTKDNFYHTNGKNIVDADITSAKIDGKELKLDFTTNNLPEGTAYVFVSSDSLKDLWDNKNEQQMIQIAVDIDKTAPEIDELEVVSESQVKITFNEDLDESSAKDKANYELLNNKGDKADLIKKVTYADKAVTIDFDENLSGNYVLLINDVEDLSNNKVSDLTKEFIVNDLTAPSFDDVTATVYNAGDTDQLVKIKFGEEMASEGKYSVLDLDKYIIDGKNLANLDLPAEISLVDNGKAVEIRVPSTKEDENGIDLTAGTNKVQIARVADKAGNFTEAFSAVKDLVAEGNVNIAKVEAIDTQTIKVSFDDELTDINVDDIVLTTDNSTKSAAEASKLNISETSLETDEDGNTVVVLTLADENKLDNTAKSSGNAVYAYIASEDSSNSYGETVKTGDSMSIADKIAPTLFDDEATTEGAEVDAVTTTGSTFTLKFTENVHSLSTALASADLVIKDNEGNALVYGEDYQINTDLTTPSNTVEFELIGDYASYTDEISVQLDSSVNYLKDGSDNTVKDIDITFDMQ